MARRVLRSSWSSSSFVVVVGAGKSALDCANWAARHSEKCTLVFRSPHWMAPRHVFGRVRIDSVIMTRFFELFLRYHRLGRFEALLHGPLRGVVRLWWQGWSGVMRRSLRLQPVLIPDAALPAGFENIGIGGEFYEAVNLGKLAVRRARIARFVGADALILDTAEPVKADVVVLATGWRQRFAFLDTDLLSKVQKNNRLSLYRHILPPQEPRLGFIGYASSTACQLTSEVGAHWLSQCFQGELSLPSVAEIEREIGRVLDWANEVFPARSEGYFVGPYLGHYLDDLLGDMRLPRKRAGNLFLEYFAPLWPHRYRNLAEQRQRKRPTAASGRLTAPQPGHGCSNVERGDALDRQSASTLRSVGHARSTIYARDFSMTNPSSARGTSQYRRHGPQEPCAVHRRR
jgi:dimethylaniline monooxygenase (N-oxide forming)